MNYFNVENTPKTTNNKRITNGGRVAVDLSTERKPAETSRYYIIIKKLLFRGPRRTFGTVPRGRVALLLFRVIASRAVE